MCGSKGETIGMETIPSWGENRRFYFMGEQHQYTVVLVRPVVHNAVYFWHTGIRTKHDVTFVWGTAFNPSSIRIELSRSHVWALCLRFIFSAYIRGIQSIAHSIRARFAFCQRDILRGSSPISSRGNESTHHTGRLSSRRREFFMIVHTCIHGRQGAESGQEDGFAISDVSNGRVRALKRSTVFHQQAPTWSKA